MTLDLWGPDTADRIISMLQQRYPIEFPSYYGDWDTNGEITPIGLQRRELAVVLEVVFADIKTAFDKMKAEEDERLAKAISGALPLHDVPLELLERTIEMLGRICVEKAAAEKAATPG